MKHVHNCLPHLLKKRETHVHYPLKHFFHVVPELHEQVDLPAGVAIDRVYLGEQRHAVHQKLNHTRRNKNPQQVNSNHHNTLPIFRSLSSHPGLSTSLHPGLSASSKLLACNGCPAFTGFRITLSPTTT